MSSETIEKKSDLSVENSDSKAVNHRTLVGRRRRAMTETKIILAAVQVFAERGTDAPVIDDFIKAAGIARGTFYNYFKSTDELLRATSEFLTEELVNLIDNEIRSFDEPAMRFGIGVRLWMRWAMANPSWCLFIARIWNSIKYEQPLHDIRKAIRKKQFLAPDPDVAWDVLSGAVRQAMFRIGESTVRRNYGDSVARMCLQALGVQSETMAEIMAFPLPKTPTSARPDETAA